jgi:hypothetical protein
MGIPEPRPSSSTSLPLIRDTSLSASFSALHASKAAAWRADSRRSFSGSDMAAPHATGITHSFTTSTPDCKLAEFAGTLEKGAHVQIEGELRYREYKKDRGSDADAAPIKRRLAEIHANRILKLDRAAKQDEPGPELDPEELPAEESAA